jgi:hypothetical protein
MIATSGIRNLIREGKTHQVYSAIQAGAKDGMIAMDQSLAHAREDGQGHLRRRPGEVQQRAGVQPARRPGLSASDDRKRRRRPMATATLSKFDYQVRDKSGKMVTGQLEADSQAAVAAKLTSMGYAPLKIDKVNEAGLQMEIKIPGLGTG